MGGPQGVHRGSVGVRWGPSRVRRRSIGVYQEVSQDKLGVRQGVCPGSVRSVGSNVGSSLKSSFGTALQIETLKLISWSR